MTAKLLILCLFFANFSLSHAAGQVDFDAKEKRSTFTALQVEVTPLLHGESQGVVGSGTVLESYGKRLKNFRTLTHEVINANGVFFGNQVCPEKGDCVDPEISLEEGPSGLIYKSVYTFAPGAFVRRTLGCNTGNWNMKLEYKYNTIGEGHEHGGVAFPDLAVYVASAPNVPAQYHGGPSPITFSNLQGNATYYFWTRLPAFATTIFQTATFSGECGGVLNDALRGRVLGLIELPPNDYLFYPDHQNSELGLVHLVNHYGTQQLVNALTNIATEYQAVFPKAGPFRVYDMSLAYGGILDINDDWKQPFYGHTAGLDADINKSSILEENRKKLLEIMCRQGDVYSEQDVPGQPSYFHIRVAKKSEIPEEDNFSEAPRTTVQCCSGGDIIPGALDVCLSDKRVK